MLLRAFLWISAKIEAWSARPEDERYAAILRQVERLNARRFRLPLGKVRASVVDNQVQVSMDCWDGPGPAPEVNCSIEGDA